jgi:hypothetical protein
MTAEQFDAFLTDSLDQDYRVLARRYELPTEAELHELGRELGVTWPDDYVRFQTALGAFYLEALERPWPQPRSYSPESPPAGRFAFAVFGVTRGLPKPLDIRHQTAAFRSRWRDSGAGLVPVFRWVGSSDRVCVDVSGQLVEFLDDCHPAVCPIEQSFIEYLVEQVRALVTANRRRKDSGANGRVPTGT